METQRQRQGLMALALMSGAVLLGFVIWFVVSAQVSKERNANWNKEPSTEEDPSKTVIRQDPRVQRFLSLEATLNRQLQKLDKHLGHDASQPEPSRPPSTGAPHE